MTVLRLHNVGVVVQDLDAAIDFFVELGLELEGRMTIEDPWAGRVTGVLDQQVEMAMVRTPDGNGRIELSKFNQPDVTVRPPATVNTTGYLRAMFEVSDIDDVVTRLQAKHGATLVGEIVQYEGVYRLCYLRGPEGLILGIAEPLGG